VSAPELVSRSRILTAVVAAAALLGASAGADAAVLTSTAPQYSRVLAPASAGVALAAPGTATVGEVGGKPMVLTAESYYDGSTETEGTEVFLLHGDGTLERTDQTTDSLIGMAAGPAGLSAIAQSTPYAAITPMKVTAAGKLVASGAAVPIAARLTAATASADGRFWAVAGDSGDASGSIGSAIWIYRVSATGAIEQASRPITISVAVSSAGPYDNIRSMSFSPDGRYLTAMDDHNEGEAARVLTFAVSAAGVLTSSDSAFAGNLFTGGVAFNSGGILEVSATGYGDEGTTISPFRLAGGLPMVLGSPTTAPIEFGRMRGLSFSPDGSLLATSGDVTQLFLVSEEGQLTWMGRADDGRLVGTATFSPDGRFLIVADQTDYNDAHGLLQTYALTSPGLDTTLTSAAPATAITEMTSASFAMDINYPASLECRLDAEPFHACDPTVSYAGLIEGHHRFQARARDLLGGVEGTPATKTWDIDRSPPDTPDLDAPADGATGVAARTSLTWMPTDDNVTGVDHYELTVDGAAVRTLAADTCENVCSGAPEAPLADGGHTWRVRAVDRAGHASDSVVWRFDVDAAAPDPFATTAPADGAPVPTRRPRLTWQRPADAGSGASRYDVTIDGRQANTRPLTTTSWVPEADLTEGAHRWSVTAYDVNGNARESASATFVVDTVAPMAALTSSAASVPPDKAITFDASASRDADAGAIVRYEWDLDGDGEFETVTATPVTSHAYSTTVPVTVPVSVQVTDAVGLTATATHAVRIVPAVTERPAALVAIDGKAAYTNTPNVTLRVDAPAFATRLEISNDASFASAPSSPITTKLAWKLDADGALKTVRRVHVRFTRGLITSDDFTAEITLDQEAPSITSARLVRSGRRWALKLAAQDRGLAGVGAVQTSSSPSAVSKSFTKVALRNGRARIGLAGAPPRKGLYVRARDKAGNVGAWVRARRS
jgi:hypothetical protein